MAEEKTKEQKQQDLIDEAVKRLKAAVKADEHNRKAAIEDLKFANGEQWTNEEKKRRSDKGRPALQINLLPKYIEQVVGDMLHNTPTIKMRPVDSAGDVNIAKIRQGIISNIEYQSNSKGIYGYAARQMVTSGFGAWRVLTRYTEENPFLQEIYLEGIRNPFLVYMDPSAKDQNYADARWGLLLEKMPTEEFEDRYPDAQLPSDTFKVGQGLADENWYDGETVTVAEYFVKTSETVEMIQLKDGRVVSEDEFKELKKEWKAKQKKVLEAIEQPAMGQLLNAQLTGQAAPPMPPAPNLGSPAPAAPNAPPTPSPSGMPSAMGQPPSMPQPPAPPAPALDPITNELSKLPDEPIESKRRKTEKTVIKHWILTCCEILEGGIEGNKVAGKYIPLVLLKGKELNIEGKNHVYSLIRHAKDPQKLINYWNTAAAEVIALAPKAPWVGTSKQFEGYEQDYATANVENYPMLKYNADPEAQGPPQRQGTGQPPVAIFEQIRRGEENLKSVIGMFNADVGAPGSEQTGAAVIARQKPGDVATFEFMENLARAVMFTGKVINEMIPEIYDTERDVRIRNIDESESFVPINTTVGNAKKSVENDPNRFAGIELAKLNSIFSKEGKDAKFNDITVGKYDVVVTVGPSYSTQRQESAQNLLQLSQAMPQQMAIAADLIVENMDFKGADELAARLRKPLVAQGVAKPRSGEQPSPPPPPNPQVQLAQAKVQGEQAKQQLAQLKIQQENIKLEHEKAKMQLEIQKLQIEMQAKSAPKQENPADREERMLRLKLEADRLELERAKFEHQMRTEGIKLTHAKTKLDADNQFRATELLRESNE